MELKFESYLENFIDKKRTMKNIQFFFKFGIKLHHHLDVSINSVKKSFFKFSFYWPSKKLFSHLKTLVL